VIGAPETGWYRSTRPPAAGPGPLTHAGHREEVVARVPDPTPGRALVTRRALEDVVRAATLGSYGVTGFAAGLPARALGAIGIGQPGLRVTVDDRLAVELDLTVAHGLPIAEVARQVDSAVRYAIHRATGRDIDHLAIHIDGLRWQPGAPPDQVAMRSTVPARPRRPRARPRPGVNDS
jgi:uncharacterized alkaline shock family protein YloU